MPSIIAIRSIDVKGSTIKSAQTQSHVSFKSGTPQVKKLTSSVVKKSGTDLVKLFETLCEKNPNCHFSEETKANFRAFLANDNPWCNAAKNMRGRFVRGLFKLAQKSETPFDIQFILAKRPGYNFVFDLHDPQLIINGNYFYVNWATSKRSPKTKDHNCFLQLLEQARLFFAKKSPTQETSARLVP